MYDVHISEDSLFKIQIEGKTTSTIITSRIKLIAFFKNKRIPKYKIKSSSDDIDILCVLNFGCMMFDKELNEIYENYLYI